MRISRGVDDRLLWSGLLVAVLIGCEIPLPPVPIPDPINPPVPVVPVPAAGERIVLILHESRDASPELARLKVQLQSGEIAAYFASKNHAAFILDKDATDQDGKPLAVIERIKANLGGKTLPVLVIGSKTTDGRFGNVLHCDTLKPDATAGDVVAIVKAKGG